MPVAAAEHIALFYADENEYVAGILDFLAPALDAGDPVVVSVPSGHSGRLTDRLDPGGSNVEILDMVEFGRNPARIIPAVFAMLQTHRGRTLHLVGEPVWPGRSRAEIQEATRHEALINLAWTGEAIRVLCPYDATRLDDAVLRDAERTHPWVIRHRAIGPSGAFAGASLPAGTDSALASPPAHSVTLRFGLSELSAVRALVGRRAHAAGLGRDRTDDLVIAVNEVATNAVKYTPEGGVLRIWSSDQELICQLDDLGHITDPLAGRQRPVAGTAGGIGLWMVNQLCDLVEVRTTARGTTIRLHAGIR
jgi:anti-sigma regulatory factor (Ser/Thr protein kinase)